MKKIITYFLVISVIVLIGSRFIKFENPNSLPSADADLILYWGNGCPHCENVKNHIKENNLDQKLKISQKEVYYNRANQSEMENYAARCPEIDKSQGLGVPFAWINSENKCLIGDTPIISWLNSKAGIGQ